jgi:hypothetical protein
MDVLTSFNLGGDYGEERTMVKECEPGHRAAKWRMGKALKFTTIMFVILLIAGCSGQNGQKPQQQVTVATKQSELTDLATALAHYHGAHVTVIRLVVSQVEPTYVSARYRTCDGNCEVMNNLLHRIRRNWQQSLHESAKLTILYNFDPGEPRDDACPFAPGKVIKNLYGVECPPARAIHAERVTSSELKSLLKTYRDNINARGINRSALGLRNACISRLSKNWAGARGVYRGGYLGVIFFHKVKRGWQFARNEPHEVSMSLETCVGFEGQ